MRQEIEVDIASNPAEDEKEEMLMKRISSGIGLNLSDLRNAENEE